MAIYQENNIQFTNVSISKKRMNMRKRIITMLAALLLISTGAFAQSGETPLKGDVNEDGKVDVADINAIIKIMKDAGGTSGETVYYYYAGWTLPSASNADTIINETYPASSSDNTQHAAGKKTTTKSSMDYTQGNLYYSTAKTYYYVLVPSNHAIYDSLGNNVIESTFILQETITVGNQIHNIYKSNGTSRNIGAIIIR